MYRHLLVPTDGSEFSRRGIDAAIGLAKALGARLTGIYAVPEYMPPVDAMVPLYQFPTPSEYAEQAAAEAELVLKDLADACAKAGLECQLTHGIDSHPYRLILATAAERGCDLICMSSHGRSGISALLLGSEAQKVLSHGQLPVLIVR
jgi:nucleotide-binding universal stress UspA family protein